MKAAASLAAMAVVGIAPRPRRVKAAAETRVVRWVEGDHPEIAPDPADGIRTVPIEARFTAIAPSWSQESGPGVLVEIALSEDGAIWTDPLIVAEASDAAGPPERDNRRFGALVFGDNAQFVRYRALDADGNVIDVPGLSLICIDSSDGPVLSDAVGGPGDDTGVWRPPIISRAAWGADESYRFDDEEIWPPDYQRVAHVIIHHTDTPSFRDPLMAIRSIYYYHAVERGWGDIGYNYLVDHMGNVYEGRTGGENVIGGHAYEYAQGSSGIGTMGDFSQAATTPEAQAGLVWITAWVGRDLDPYGSGNFHTTKNLPTICAHRDVNDTTCPGDALYDQLDVIRDHVAAVLDGADPTLDPDFFPGDLVTVTVDDGNLRAGPSTDFDVLDILPVGTELVVTGGPATTSGYSWYAVTGAAGAGWCAAVILERQTPPSSRPSFEIGDWVAVETDSLSLRVDAGRSAPAMASLGQGAEGLVVDGPLSADGFMWYQLDTEDGTGWVAGAYLVGLSSGRRFGIGDAVVVDTDTLTLRDGAGTKKGALARMPGGTRLSVTGGPVAANGHRWYAVWSSRYGAGWAAGTYLVAAGESAAFGIGQTVSVADGPLSLRTAPGYDGAVRDLLPDGTTMTITGAPATADDLVWYPVDGDTGGGWCAGPYLAAIS